MPAVELVRYNNSGSEAATAAQQFLNLDASEQGEILSFLLSLRTPRNPASDLLNRGEDAPGQGEN